MHRCEYDEFGIIIAANGAEHIKGRCSGCGKIRSNPYPRKSFSEDQINNMGIWRVSGVAIECEYEGCTRTDTELHHNMPSHLADDAGKWAKTYYCRGHHKEWHDIVTPDMRKRKTMKCPKCKLQINYTFLTHGIDEELPRVQGWPKRAWGEPGARWIVCHAFDGRGREFWHIRVKLRKNEEHRLAWMVEG